MQHPLFLQVLLPLFCYCQLDNFAWGTRGIDATETAGEGTTEIAEKKAYEVCLTFCQDCLLMSAFALDCLCVQFIACVLLCFAPLLAQCKLTACCQHSLSLLSSKHCICTPAFLHQMCATLCVSHDATPVVQVGYKRMRPRTNKRSAFATKCMVLAAYLTVNMGIGCCIAVTTTWFWWVYMMMGILLFLLGVRIIIFGLSLIALVQFSRRHRRQRRAKADRAALELKAARAVRQASAQDMQLGQQQLSTAASAARQDSTQSLMQSAWSSFSAMQREASQMQLVLEVGKTGAAGGAHLTHQPLQLAAEWCQHSYASHHPC